MKKYELKGKTYLATEKDSKVMEIAKKHGIEMPSEDLAIFVTKYAALEDANLNGVRLASDAVEKFLKSINGKLADIDHIRPYVIGSILEGWINSDTKEIEIAFTMYKSVFIDEYAQALEKLNAGELAVSFELTTNPDTIESLQDGTIRLHDMNFSGVGLLLNTNPAYPKAKVYEMANRLLNKVSKTNMVFASQIAEELGANVVAEIEKVESVEEIDAAKWTTKYINSLPNSSFAVIEPAYLDGKTDNKNTRHLPFKDENGKVDLPHLRNALARANQIQAVTDSISTDALRAKAESELKKYTHLLKTGEETLNLQEGGQSKMEFTQEQKDLIAKRKVDLGEKAKDWKDEDFLNEAKLVEAGYTVETKHDCTQVKEVQDNGDAKVTTTDNTTTTVVNPDGTKSVTTEQNQNVCTYTQEQVDQMIQPYATIQEENEALIEAAVPKEVITRTKELIKQGLSPKDAVKQAWDEYKKKNASEETDEIKLLQSRIKELEDAETARQAAIVKAEADAKLAEIKEGLKDNPYVKDFTDADYLNVEKVEKAKLQKENDDLKAKLASTSTKEVVATEPVKLITGHEETPVVKTEYVGNLINKLGKD